MQKEQKIRDAREHGKAVEPERRPKQDNSPTECGLTREELRVLVIEMIG